MQHQLISQPFFHRFVSNSPVFKLLKISREATSACFLSGGPGIVGFLSRPAFLFPLIIFLLMTGQPAIADNQYDHPTQRPYIVDEKVYNPLPSSSGYKETGIASWYGPDFNGHPTSNGEVYDMHEQTAAHKILPMNTMLLVSNLENGKNTIVRVNDRGPFVHGRIVDLSYTAAKKLDLVDSGTAKVQVTALGQGDTPSGNNDNAATNSPAETNSRDINYNLGDFYVQIGAFGQKNNAIKLQKRFSDTGHTTVIQEFFSQKSILYRVCVYAGQELHGAYKVEEALHNHGWRGAFVVAR
jgi:rare lipoprotein A